MKKPFLRLGSALFWVLAAVHPASAAPAPAADLDAYVGDYVDPQARCLPIRRRGDDLFCKSPRGYVQLVATGADAFTGGANRITFSRGENGEIRELVLATPDGRQVAAKREDLPYRSREVQYRNGPITLSGTLLVPSGPGPHPAVLVMPGIGELARVSTLPESLAVHLARNGIAVLTSDRRGVGASQGGDWKAATFPDQAEDALAGLAFLKSRDGIDPRGIGLLGESQGGWTAPIAASRFSESAFLVLVSASAFSPAEQEKRVFLTGLPPGKGEEALSAWLRIRQAAGSGRLSDEEILALVKTAQAEWWWPVVAAGGAPREEKHLLVMLKKDQLIPGIDREHDPSAALREIRCPVLAIYGGQDPWMPPGLNVPGLEKPLKEAGVSLTVKIFPGASHVVTGPEYHKTVSDWILKNASKGLQR